jgi:putative transposase
MHAELRMGHGFRIGQKRLERIMREHGWAGAVKRKFRFRANPATSEDRVNRNFHVTGPNRLWLNDITEHHTAGIQAGEGKVYCAVVLDAYSRLAIGWSISSRMTADLVVDALQMAGWRRFGVRGRSCTPIRVPKQYTSWAFNLPRPRSRLARLDGQCRGLLRQRDGGIVLVRDIERVRSSATVLCPQQIGLVNRFLSN